MSGTWRGWAVWLLLRGVPLGLLLAIARLVEVLDRSERPILIHCHQGADRTGLASVMALLLRPGVPLAETRRQLGLASGHVSIGRTGHVDHFLDLYETWLARTDRPH